MQIFSCQQQVRIDGIRGQAEYLLVDGHGAEMKPLCRVQRSDPGVAVDRACKVPATQQEIDTAEAKISKDKISREMGLDRIEEQLRRARPELFKA